MFINYYQVLGIQSTATMTDVKAAYRRLAMQYHPDKNKEPHAAQKFIEITEAYEVLCDPQKRSLYDFLYTKYFIYKETTVATEASSQQQQTSWAEQGRRKAQEYASMPYNEFLQRVFNEIRLGAKYVPNLVFIFFCLLGAIGLIRVLPKAFTDNDAPSGAGVVLLLLIIGFGVLGFFLFKRMKANYIEERTHTFKK